MIRVIKEDKSFPFSKGILARSISRSGLSIKDSYEIVRDILADLREENINEITSDKLKNRVSKQLLQRDLREEERYYRVRREIKYLDSPIFVLIGGGSGVGKTTIALEVATRLGISKVIGTDTIREIMRSIVSSNLIPTLHESSFTAGDSLRTPFVSNKLIHGFEEQVSLVSQGVASVLKRGKKEGLNIVLDGVHIVPGFIENRLDERPKHLFQYVLNVPSEESHIQRFYTREEGSLRDPERYIDRLDRIRQIQNYIIKMADKSGVQVIENKDYEKTLNTILEDIVSTLEEEI